MLLELIAVSDLEKVDFSCDVTSLVPYAQAMAIFHMKVFSENI